MTRSRKNEQKKVSYQTATQLSKNNAKAVKTVPDHNATKVIGELVSCLDHF